TAPIHQVLVAGRDAVNVRPQNVVQRLHHGGELVALPAALRPRVRVGQGLQKDLGNLHLQDVQVAQRRGGGALDTLALHLVGGLHLFLRRRRRGRSSRGRRGFCGRRGLGEGAGRPRGGGGGA